MVVNIHRGGGDVLLHLCTSQKMEKGVVFRTVHSFDNLYIPLHKYVKKTFVSRWCCA